VLIQQVYSGAARCSPLFFAPPSRLNSRIPAAKTMPLADNFLQKQQKHRDRAVSGLREQR
jgi:hypothetical protein